jgi:four helix bundle protein
MDLSTAVYAVTKAFPKEEMFGLTSQLRRASVPWQATSLKDRAA